MSTRQFLKQGVVLAVLWATGQLGAVTLTNVTTANVTPGGFNVVFQMSTGAEPDIEVFADASGLTNLAGQVGVEWYPVHTGSPQAADPYQQRVSRDTLRARTRQRGVAHVRVTDCLPATTYYYRVSATDTNGATVRWPASAPLESVTTAQANAFLTDSRQLVIDLGEVDAEGQCVLLENENAPYALAAVAGDGVGPDKVFFNLSDLLAPGGRTNFVPVGLQEFAVRLPGRQGASATNVYGVTFTAQFVVGTPEDLVFMGQDAVLVSLGRTVLWAGDSGSITLGSVSTAGLTNVAFDLDIPTNTLVNLNLTGLAPEVAQSAVQTVSPTRRRITLQTAPGLFLQGTQQLATLTFGTSGSQHSAFRYLLPSGITAVRGDGSQVTNVFSGAGRVAVVGPEPLVETLLAAGGGPAVLLYGRTNVSYRLELTHSLLPPVRWQGGPLAALTNIVQEIAGNWPGSQTFFVRAVELSGGLTAVQAIQGARDIQVYGAPGSGYQLLYTTNLSGTVAWKPQLSFTLTNRFQTLPNPGPSSPVIFYRVSKP